MGGEIVQMSYGPICKQKHKPCYQQEKVYESIATKTQLYDDDDDDCDISRGNLLYYKRYVIEGGMGAPALQY